MPSTSSMMPSAMGRKERTTYGREKQKIPNARQRMPMTSVPLAVKPRFLAFIKYQKLCAAYKMSAAAMPQQKTVPDMPGQNVSTRPSAM